MTPPPPARGKDILEAVNQLGGRLNDKFVSEQHRDNQVQQILLSINHLTTEIRKLQQVIRFEHDTTRRALRIHFGAEGLDVSAELESVAELANEHGA